MEFHASIDRLPPSSNKLRSVYRGRLVTTAEARKFRHDCFEQLKEFDPPKFDRDHALKLEITFCMPDLENSGWPGKSKHRYKKRDVSNLLKLVEDVVCIYLGIDDSQFLSLTAKKKSAPKPETKICVRSLT